MVDTHRLDLLYKNDIPLPESLEVSSINRPIRPMFSVVTISFNQAGFLPDAIRSVLVQRETGSHLEYIICDPGSTDGSRDIINEFGGTIDIRVFEPDDGPADGLNRGFARASGDIFCYINADDCLLPGAFALVERYFRDHPDIDVITGHGFVIDEQGRIVRRIWSDPFRPWAVASGAHVQVQQSTFIRAEAFHRSGGFDPADRGCWDSTLLVSLWRSGARFAVMNEFLSCFRVYPGSITGSGRLSDIQAQSLRRQFIALMGREPRALDRWAGLALRVIKHLAHPWRTLERLRRGAVV